LSNTAAINLRDNWKTSWDINLSANGLQILELSGSPEALAAIQSETPSTDEGPSLSYPLSGAISLASRSDQQMLRIMDSELDAKLYHVASPMLTPHVYREVELVNDSVQDLLGGAVSCYLDGRFVGRTEISTVARGQTFVVGLGVDPQLKASRELLQRESTVQGGNQVLEFRYRLTVENYKGVAVPVRLLERIPYADKPEELQVVLRDLDDPLSEDPLYVRLERPKGLLRWEFDVAPHAAGEHARLVQYGYILSFDRDHSLASPLTEEATQIQQDFLEQQRFRFLK